MRKSRLTEQQIVGILKAVETRRKVSDVRREHGIAEGTHLPLESEVR